MKKPTTDEEALRLLYEGGNIAPSPARVEVTRRVLDACAEMEVKFTNWNDSLYPELDDLLDVELFVAVEEEFDVALDDEDISTSQMKTFGDMVCYLESYIAFLQHRIANEKGKITNANCATQSAFYAVRRRLLDTGAAYHQVHGLRPDVRLLDVPAKHAEPLARGLEKDYGLLLPVQRVLWGRISTAAVQWAFFAASITFCVFASLHLPFVFWGGTMLCFLINVAFGCLVSRYSRCKWPRDMQTLGDVARKIAATVPPVGAAQTAS